uniref:Retrotransposon gag domain-containing protein n=1 Tax=Moniliophthora roreri TaxID=221103 RepID=A0A0W0G6H2_MONRR
MPPWTESQIERDIVEAEERRCGLQTQSILNPGGQVIPPLTRASRRELLTSSPLPLPTNPVPTETPEERLETKRTLTPLSITTGLGEIKFEEEMFPSTPKKPELDILNTSSTSAEESDPFQHLLHIEEMSEEKKPSGSRPKVEPIAEETTISATVPVQMVTADKEIKAALPRAFTGHRKDMKKFLREVQLYIALNPKAFTTDRSKKLFLLFYMTNSPGEFWKNDKTDLLLALDPEAGKVSWVDFMEDFKMSFEPLDTTLEAQLKL